MLKAVVEEFSSEGRNFAGQIPGVAAAKKSLNFVTVRFPVTVGVIQIGIGEEALECQFAGIDIKGDFRAFVLVNHVLLHSHGLAGGIHTHDCVIPVVVLGA